MTQVTYVGDPRYGGDGPAENTVFGVTFKKGEAVEVSDELKYPHNGLDESVVSNLAKNNHFKVAGKSDHPEPPLVSVAPAPQKPEKPETSPTSYPSRTTPENELSNLRAEKAEREKAEDDEKTKKAKKESGLRSPPPDNPPPPPIRRG